ncbi:hypothetical protein IE53DRAFT_388631 [Violaceomyces palustris]|uniref:Uncharacterized protein n=1 Tax=Violaceomyces palustris TaxID=1673888 RepID=A0ACD0NTN5_9BASI|nr:hypothetical protein IE53DRAFT_388631 [Violaceomyces palustris]
MADPASRGGGLSMSQSLLSEIEAYSTLARCLFASIESPSNQTILPPQVAPTPASSQSTTASIQQILALLSERDRRLATRIETARKHHANQLKIKRLVRRATQRDATTRKAIQMLNGMNSELEEIVELAREEEKAIQAAERDPIQYDVLLSYAQKLSRYTSAPPGFKLPKLEPSSPPPGDKPTQSEQQGDLNQSLSLGPDYNQAAKRATGYYDPAMPSMPQEMPFPSDALMRQGILNLQAGASALLDSEQQEEHEVEEAQDHDFNPQFSQFHLQQGQQHQEEEGDAFDLDLNP